MRAPSQSTLQSIAVPPARYRAVTEFRSAIPVRIAPAGTVATREAAPGERVAEQQGRQRRQADLPPLRRHELGDLGAVREAPARRGGAPGGGGGEGPARGPRGPGGGGPRR